MYPSASLALIRDAMTSAGKSAPSHSIFDPLGQIADGQMTVMVYTLIREEKHQEAIQARPSKLACPTPFRYRRDARPSPPPMLPLSSRADQQQHIPA